jgi:hypothetical protein
MDDPTVVHPHLDLGLGLHFVTVGEGNEYIEAAGWHFEAGLRTVIAQELDKALRNIRKENTLILIGYMGGFTAYVNLSVEEAKRRYEEEDRARLVVLLGQEDEEYVPVDWQDIYVKQFVFEDSFRVYAAWPK